MPRVPTLRIPMLALAFALAVFATTQLDRVVGDIVSTTQSPSAPWPESLWLINALLLPLLPLALVFFYGVSLGGLPIALLAIVLHMINRTRGSRRPVVLQSLYYACFITQMLSTAFSAFWLVVFSGIDINSYFGAYLTVQLVAGVVALPVWRLLLDRATRSRLDTRVLRLAA
jgi:MFS family permease